MTNNCGGEHCIARRGVYRVPRGEGQRPATELDAALPRLVMNEVPGAHPWKDYDIIDTSELHSFELDLRNVRRDDNGTIVKADLVGVSVIRGTNE